MVGEKSYIKLRNLSEVLTPSSFNISQIKIPQVLVNQSLQSNMSNKNHFSLLQIFYKWIFQFINDPATKITKYC